MTRRRQLDFHWKLRQQMAAHDMWKTTQLAPLLRERGIDLSAAQIYRLVTDKPERLSMKVLVALCDIFDCTPNDLITSQPEGRLEQVLSNTLRRSVGVQGLVRVGPAERMTPGLSPARQSICRECAGITTALDCTNCGREAEGLRGGHCARCVVTADLTATLRPQDPPDL